MKLTWPIPQNLHCVTCQSLSIGLNEITILDEFKTVFLIYIAMSNTMFQNSNSLFLHVHISSSSVAVT